MTKYKTLNGTAGSYGHGDYTDYLPHGKRPGKWLPPVKPELCASGYHWCEGERQLVHHLGEYVYVIEERGECVRGEDKCASKQIRLTRRVETWNERTQRLFAVDCARQVAHLTPDPELTHACLDLCVAYTEYGEEWDAARAAAEWDAARAAAADAALAAADAALAAADAAGDATAAAARAADAAARAAARAAAGDAWHAADAAARAAAAEAAWHAAGDAQARLLARYLAGEEGPFVEAQ